MKVEIKNRWTGSVQFIAEVECDEGAAIGIKIGLAVKWAWQSGAVLSDADLSDAVLRGADLRGAVLRGAVLRDADLSDAVLRDADLRDADLSGAVLRDADLSDAVLRDADLRDADLSGADLSGAVLRGAVLRDADLRDADLRGAVLRDAVLSGADLSGNLKGVPVVPNIDAAILAAVENGQGHLDMGHWHKCETTHCRAGWAIVLAGAGGAALEFALGSAAAGALIYAASRPGQPIPDFYASNEAAMQDMRETAAKAAAEDAANG